MLLEGMRIKGGRGRRPLVAERLAKRVLSMAMGKDFRFLGRKERSAEALEETGFRTRVWGETLPNRHSAAAILESATATATRQQRFHSAARQPPFGSAFSVCKNRSRHPTGGIFLGRFAAAVWHPLFCSRAWRVASGGRFSVYKTRNRRFALSRTEGEMGGEKII